MCTSNTTTNRPWQTPHTSWLVATSWQMMKMSRAYHMDVFLSWLSFITTNDCLQFNRLYVCPTPLPTLPRHVTTGTNHCIWPPTLLLNHHDDDNVERWLEMQMHLVPLVCFILSLFYFPLFANEMNSLQVSVVEKCIKIGDGKIHIV